MTDDLSGRPGGAGRRPCAAGSPGSTLRADAISGAPFVEATDAERRRLLDRIAYPDDADASEDAPGVAFFSRFRDYTAAGYFSSPQGIEDLGYIGNVARPAWPGCPAEVARHIGLTA